MRQTVKLIHQMKTYFIIYSAQDDSSMANDKWVVKATINSKPVRFRIDTGAKSSIIVKSVFDSLGSCAQTRKSTKVLKSYTNQTSVQC